MKDLKYFIIPTPTVSQITKQNTMYVFEQRENSVRSDWNIYFILNSKNSFSLTLDKP